MKKTTISLLVLLLITYSGLMAQVQVDKFTGDVMYGLPLITVPNFRGPSVSTSISYKSDIKVDQPASEVGLGWNINAGGSIERVVKGVPDDWFDVDVPDMQAASFQKHLGALYFGASTTYSTVLDFDYTRYKMDTLNDTIKYYYPNYDSYYVTGAGMAGKIVPEQYDFPTVTIDTSKVNRWFYNRWYHPTYGWLVDSISVGIKEIETYSLDSAFRYKTHFQYEHNMYGEVDSYYYPWDESPISSSTPILLLGESNPSDDPTYSGSGYNDEDYSIAANQNRARTSNYIEYFTNEEIDTGGVSGFMEYDTTFARGTEADFPQAGIGGFRITDPNGYTYHYSLPVYAHYNTSGSISLDKDYDAVIAEGGIMDITDSTNGYVVESDYTHEILEIKQIKKYAVRWLLTAITGPDFEDSNSNGVVDMDDAGYWVKYDYGLWTESFAQRYPYYGGSYSFSSNVQEGLWPKFIDENDSSKITGKALSYSETANQLYYLNQIQTPSHTGIFCRDLRYDEQSMIANFDKSNYQSTKLLNQISEDIHHWSGEGSFRVNSPAHPYYHYLTIQSDDVDSMAISFNFPGSTPFQGTSNTRFIILDGDTATGDTLVNYYIGCSCSDDDTVYSSGNEITVIAEMPDSVNSKIWYDIAWWSYWDNSTGGWPNGRTEATPQLKLSKMFLFDNDDLDSLPSISAIDTISNDELWDYDNVNSSDIYNTDWYEANQETIDGLALKSVDLEQDYSLAKGWYNNRYVYLDIQSKTASPVEVEANKYIDDNNTASSGKLTLNKVTYYGLNRTQTQPSHLFDYNASDTTDNPEYNPLRQDYWGNFKSDAENNLLRGFVTDASKSRTDAWSLRTVTSPLGGTTDITYESDEYEQVLSEDKDGEMRGPVKTFALKNVAAISGEVGGGWTFDLENQSDEFWDLKDNLPTGATTYATIPCAWVDSDSYSYTNYYYDPDKYLGFGVSSGSGTLTESGSKILDLDFYDINTGSTYTTPLDSSTHLIWDYTGYIDSLIYSGNGFVSFEYPVGEKVKGGGTRVKELTVSNGTDNYTVSYTYDEGTATAEASDFSKRKTKVDEYDNRYDWTLTSMDYNPFGMSPQVGYGKVTIENKGQGTAGQGKSVFYFNVSDDDHNYFEPYATGRIDTSWQEGMCGPVQHYDYNIRFAVEVIDDFTTIWGKIKEQDLLDVNDNMVSKKVYEYETSTKGAYVSTTNFNVPDSRTGSCADYNTYVPCIYRSYPNYLAKVTTYSNGRKSTSEIIDRDIFTGDPIETKNTSVNGTITTEEIVLARTQTSTPDYTTMGAKSVDPGYDNFLNATYSSKTFKAGEGLTTPDFSSYGKSFWKDSVKTRYYNSTDDEYSTQVETVNWFDYVKYAWTGDLGDYGLFDSTAFTDITSPPAGASDWRYISEITLMDEEQNVLEQKGYNDRFSASKLGYDNRFTYTSASNSNYVSFTATGFETETEVETGVDYYEGEVLAQSGNVRKTVDGNVYPHTGNYMVKIPSANTAGPIYKVNYDATEDIYSLQRGRTYTASVWVHKDSPDSTQLHITIEGDSQSSSYSKSDTMSIVNEDAIQIGDWIQLTVNIDVPEDFTGTTAGDGIEVYVDKGPGDAWIDDMQFHSRVTGSGMNVYDQKTGRVMATLSDNNFATKYVYNDAGQVTEVWKEVLGDTWGKWVKVESRDFNFKRSME